MHPTSAGIGGQYPRPDNDENQPDNRAASSRRGRYRQGTVTHWDNPPSTTPRRHECHHSFDPYSSQYLQRRSVNPAQDFNALIEQEIMDDLLRKSGRFGHRYDGRHHGQYASSIKKYTSAAKRPLNRAEQGQLIRLLQNFTATRHWNWRSLTTTLHSLTSAGVFTTHKPMDPRVKRTQAALLSTLLDAIIFKFSQKPQARDIDAQGIANLLWAMAKLVDHGQEQTPEFKEALAALLPHVNTHQDQFIPQHIANLLWAMAKLVNNGQERTPKLTEAVAALLPHVNAQKANFKPQGIANLLWAMAKLMDYGQEPTPEFKEALAALLPHVNAHKDQFIPQHIANLLWAMAKLVGNAEWAPEFKEAVAALLPHVNAHQDQFIPQHIANLLLAMAKLVDYGQERTPEFNKAVAALLPHVNAQKTHFKPQEIANLLCAMAKLVDNRQELTPELKEAVVALLPLVNAQRANFKPQEIANLLWAMAKLVDNGQKPTTELKETVAALLPCVNVQKDQFIPQHIANLVWAMAKLVDYGQEWIPGLKEAVATLLPHVKAQKNQFNAQGIANLLWAIAKLLDHGHEQTPEFKEVVAALLPHVNTQKYQFIPQHIAVLLWAMAKLVDKGQKLTPEFKEAVAALLPLVTPQKDQFISQHIANLLWAMAKLGEFVELNQVISSFEYLVQRISNNPQLSQQEIFMSLWGIMVCCARLSLVSNTNNVLEKHLNDLFTRLENTSPNNKEDRSIMAMAASWLGRTCPVVPHYQTNISKPQTDFRDQLQSCIPSLKIEEEKSLNALPPVDLLLPDHNIVIEVQGSSHYVGGDFKTRNGSTLLKIALLQKAGFEVIEIPVNMLLSQDLMKPYINQIKTRVDIPPQGHGSVSHKKGGSDEVSVTADKEWQPSDHCYIITEEHSEEQIISSLPS
ncbi:DUF1601 domain-containing protein [Thalassotalea sp. G20_0]|uniref:DUF1601 domain-containing protein n=1 Tax=Thalassotalea sp. G20_0 TaxID=2821093 RepID=UPI001ADA33A0|nr:DUF1601 domain-containing protein [Thalassotalea sp. G20_0]MBO9493767.1 DUF1601 domain-containing protein [Thalassotalea sp. G20_0]